MEYSVLGKCLEILCEYLLENQQQPVMQAGDFNLRDFPAMFENVVNYLRFYEVNIENGFSKDWSNYKFEAEPIPGVEFYYFFGKEEKAEDFLFDENRVRRLNYILFENWGNCSTLVLHVEEAKKPLPFVERDESMSLAEWREYLYQDLGCQRDWVEVEV